MDAHASQVGGDARPDLPEVGEGLVVPQFFPEGELIQLRNPDPVLVGGHFFGGDVHGDLGQVQIGANAPCGSDPRRPQHIPDHGGDQVVGSHVVERTIRS